MHWQLVVKEGGPAGQAHRVGDAPLVFGRDPGPDGVILGNDRAVSRRHFEIEPVEEGLILHNHSANGTELNGETVHDSCPLAAGDVVRAGDVHAFEVVRVAREQAPPPPPPAPKAPPREDRSATRVTAPGGAAAARPPAAKTAARAKPAEAPRGLLQRPAVLAGLGIYLAAMVVAFVVLAKDKGAAAGPAWGATREAYLNAYTPEGLSAEEKQRRLDRADELRRELDAHAKAGRLDLARAACVDIMRLDADPDSPLYRMAARRYAALPRPRRR